MASPAGSDQGCLSAECPRNLFTARSGEDELPAQEPREAGPGESFGDSLPVPSGNQTSPKKKRVRERPPGSETEPERQDRAERPAHPSNRLIAQLNERWRVVDDPLQWILQRRKGNPRSKNSGWSCRSFLRTREGLLCRIREYCCPPDQGELRSIREYQGVDESALEQVRALPDWHSDWDQKDHTNLDVRGTDQAQVDGLSEPLCAQGLEPC